MTSQQIRQRFLDFFKNRDHVIIDPAPLVTTDDAGATNATLFNTSGMQPLIPYLMGEEHPSGTRLADAQPCIRTVDIDEVGDNTHATMFEMLGNWSLGDYFKKEAIEMSLEFLTNKEEGLGLDVNRLYITVFGGNDEVGRDDEAKEIWMSLGIPEHRIYYLSTKDNWWTAGPNSPAGPSSEMFYDLTDEGLGDMTHQEFLEADDRQDVVEIWNDVFMSYRQENGKVTGELANRNIDTGSGLERITAVVQGKKSIFETDLFTPLIDRINEFTESTDEAAKRIVADHIKAATFLAAEGVAPSNTGRGYILRRLVRRAARFARTLGVHEKPLELVRIVIEMYGEAYPHLASSSEMIAEILGKEEKLFLSTLEKGEREFEKGERDAFTLFTTYGFPLEMTIEMAEAQGEKIDIDEFNRKMKDHADKSRTAGAGAFKGGLADATDPAVIKLHTAHHLLLAALQQVLGSEVKQRGSNITADRLRIDFNFDRKMTPEEKEQVENIVNAKISEALPVVCKSMPREEAENMGAQMEFGQKYPDEVSVYIIGDEQAYFSAEFCGGPHVVNTSELGTFKIKKEESSSAGVRRIKATLD